MLYALAIATFVAHLSATSHVPSKASKDPNMNGEYDISPTPGKEGNLSWVRAYKDYPNGTQYFDAYSAPFQTLYSQIWWAGLPPQPIPQHVVEQFEGGKVIRVRHTV